MAKATKPQAAPAEAAAEQPYYLQRAHIKDFRSIRDAKVEFKPGLNIIIGPNGSGKTNFVRVVNNALRADTNQLGSDNEFVFNGQHTVQIRIVREARLLKSNEQVVSVLDINKWSSKIKVDGIQQKGKDFNYSWTGIEYKRVLRGLAKPVSLDSPILINHGVPSDYKLISEPISLSIEPNLSGMPDVKTQFTRVVVEGIFLSLFYLSAHEVIDLAKFSKGNLLEDLVKKVVDYNLERVKPDLVKFSPIKDVRLVDSARVYVNALQNEVNIQGAVIEFNVSDTWLPFQSLSSGTQRLFYIISEICSPLSFYFVEANEAGYRLNEFKQTILLEEPELGIHPDQLHKLLLFLREQSEQHQIIITTHSPQVLDMLNDDELDRITICELDGKKGTQFRKLSKKSIATAKRYMKEVGFLSDYWRYGSLEEKG